MSLLTKKVLTSAFFCANLLLLSLVIPIFLPNYLADNKQNTLLCPSSETAEEFIVHHIIDGDTFVLNSGEKVRILGINTPEMKFSKPEQSQALAIEARNKLKQLLPDGIKVKLIFDQKKRDRYKRLLAFVRYANDQDVAEQLLLEGLAWQYLILPNQLCWHRYQKAETKAFDKKTGVWNNKNYSVNEAKTVKIDINKRSYKRLRGLITATQHSKKTYWFIVDNRIWVGVSRKDKNIFHYELPNLKIGRSLQVSGWLYQSYGKLRIKLKHPQAIRFLDD